MIKCPNCGGEMEYLPGTEIVKCEYCGSEFTPEELGLKKGVTAEEHNQPVDFDEEPETIDAVAYICPQCGGEILSTEEAAVTFCSYCGSQVTLQSRLVKMKKPDCIIPFKIPQDECRKEYLKKVRGAIFAPSSMKKNTEIEKFRGIYMPYWVYEAHTNQTVIINSHTEHRSGNYIIRDNYATTIGLKGSIDGIAFDASSVFSDEMSAAIAPYDITESEPFNPAYMSSFYADKGDVDNNIYIEQAVEYAKDAIAVNMIDDQMKKVGMTRDDFATGLKMPKIDTKLGYFPVWFLAAKNRKGDRVSYATVNGQTGKIAVDLPVDFLKYIIGSLIIAIPLFILLTLGVTMTPKVLNVIVVILSVIVMIVANFSLNSVYRRKEMVDDIGLASRDPSQVEMVKKLQREARKDAMKARKSNKDAGGLIGSLIMSFFICIFIAVFFDWLPLFLILWIPLTAFRTIGWGMNNKRHPGVKFSAPFGTKMKTLWKSGVGILICAFVYFIHPVADYYYYGAGIIAIIFAAWTVFDIIKLHNVLTVRPLPQFGKRGGDEREY